MAISIEQVEHIAKLSRLHLSSAEKTHYQKQMEKVLDYVEHLSTLNTENIVPAFHAQELLDHFREDEQQASFSEAETFANAPVRSDAFFEVPRMSKGNA